MTLNTTVCKVSNSLKDLSRDLSLYHTQTTSLSSLDISGSNYVIFNNGGTLLLRRPSQVIQHGICTKPGNKATTGKFITRASVRPVPSAESAILVQAFKFPLQPRHGAARWQATGRRNKSLYLGVIRARSPIKRAAPRQRVGSLLLRSPGLQFVSLSCSSSRCVLREATSLLTNKDALTLGWTMAVALPRSAPSAVLQQLPPGNKLCKFKNIVCMNYCTESNS